MIIITIILESSEIHFDLVSSKKKFQEKNNERKNLLVGLSLNQGGL